MNDSAIQVLLTNSYPPYALQLVKTMAPAGFEVEMLSSRAYSDSAAEYARAEFIVAGGKVAIDQAFLEKFPNLRMIHRSGVGLDSLNMADIRSRGVALYYEPGINSRAVAEHSVLLLLAVLRQLPVALQQVHTGNWSRHNLGLGSRELSGLKVGIVGFGHTGRQMAAILLGFGCKIVYSSKRPPPDSKGETGAITHVTLEELLQTSDVVSLHLPLLNETRTLMTRGRLFSMKQGSVLINTSRGALVDEKALYEALQSKHLLGCGSDVFETEPLRKDSPLLTLQNFIATPHIAGLTEQSFVRMLSHALENIRLFHLGEFQAISAEKVI